MSAAFLARSICGILFEKVNCTGNPNTVSGKDNGFGSQYVWAQSLESGVQIANNHKKPIMLIIHKSWCSACKKLKPKFASSLEIQSLSRHFVMVNLSDDDEPKNEIFAPDGNYIPRIIFLTPDGSVDPEIINEEGSGQHKYFYSKPEQIAKSMKAVLDKYKDKQFDDLFEDFEEKKGDKPDNL